MELHTSLEERKLTISLAGDLDHHEAKDVMNKLDALMEQNLPSKTILDFGKISFMDSSGIAVIIRAKRRMEALGGNLLVINIPKQAAKVLETAGLNRYMTLL